MLSSMYYVLDNHSLTVKILEREPATLEAALSIASRLEAYERTTVTITALESFDIEREKGRHRNFKVVKQFEPSQSSEIMIANLTEKLAESISESSSRTSR